MSVADVTRAIAITAEITGASLTAAAIAVMTKDLLDAHGEESVLRALARCRRELSRPLTSGAVFERLAEDDGRPGADEAWALALSAADDAETVVWNQEIQQALAAARPILDAGDKVGARMAFRDAYERIVRENRESRLVPEWSVSLGWDKARRKEAVEMAGRKGLLSSSQVAALLPAPSGGIVEAALFGNKHVDDEVAGRWIKKIRGDLRAAKERRKEAVEAAAKAAADDLAERKRKAAEAVAAKLSAADGLKNND